jgi:hypothetical protein
MNKLSLGCNALCNEDVIQNRQPFIVISHEVICNVSISVIVVRRFTVHEVQD